MNTKQKSRLDVAMEALGEINDCPLEGVGFALNAHKISSRTINKIKAMPEETCRSCKFVRTGKSKIGSYHSFCGGDGVKGVLRLGKDFCSNWEKSE